MNNLLGLKNTSQSSFDQLCFIGLVTGFGGTTLIDDLEFLIGFWGNDLSDGKAGPVLFP